ncbi:hypothetical protein ONE63_000665 [Megalurothrips usitatus]|uniref:Palmitoleoyl-protein carboxylesterase NOTUM n=1 Tax=Megalurothrips usitatus TaxID=439358 RepID=A0AAV7XZ61_9NEOP|nr:hypothetical protein ONE63_000665 [Megalurothrips usitatus]
MAPSLTAPRPLLTPLLGLVLALALRGGGGGCAATKALHRDENAVLPSPDAPAPPASPRSATPTSPQAAVQEMMMEAIKCCPVDEQRGMRRVFLSNPNVTCNDGSPAGFYIRRSHGSRKWIIFLEGGWYCYDTWSCHHRWLRLRHLMTSKQWPDVRNVGGILSTAPEENPYAWNANHVLVPYCSSDSWSGASAPGRDASSSSPSSFSFMGALIVQEVVRDLVAHGLHNESHILLAGTSAGGTGVMLNVDAVQELVRAPRPQGLGLPQVAVRGLVDSGWFLDRAPFSLDGPYGPNRALSASDAVQQGMSMWRARVPAACAAHYRAEPWRCYFGYRLYPTIRAPLFIFQWLFDEAQMTADNVGAPVTKQQWDFIHKMGDNFRTTFKNVSAVFAPSCIAHTVLTKRDWASVRIDRVTLPAALRCWDARHPGPHTSPPTMVSDSPAGAAPEEKHKRKKSNNRKQRKGQAEGRARAERAATRGPCPSRHVEMCSWPQCSHSCPKLHNPFTGEEMDFIELLKSFGLDMASVANALGIDIHTLNNMDHEELLNLLTQQAN